MDKKQKSRHLSVYEFFQILQIEWIVADLRTRIYVKKKDRDFWSKVKEGKKQTIENIAEQNNLPTIFSDDEMKRAFTAKVYLKSGPPNFLYKNEGHKMTQESLDLLNYYSKGAHVRFESFQEVKVGIIQSYSPIAKTVCIKWDEALITLPIQEVTRVI